MSFFKMKIRTADKYFSKYLRNLRGFKCEYCGKTHEENSRNFGLSHYHGRAKESTRYDEDNCDVLCNIPCHQYFETHKTEYEQWKKKKLGKRKFDLLFIRANTYCKRDDKLQTMIWKKMLKDFK